MFQSTRPRGARRDTNVAFPAAGWKFQSTRPRGARRRHDRPRARRDPVSIHAPARGATTPSA